MIKELKFPLAQSLFVHDYFTKTEKKNMILKASKMCLLIKLIFL